MASTLHTQALSQTWPWVGLLVNIDADAIMRSICACAWTRGVRSENVQKYLEFACDKFSSVNLRA
jgi:hypothetical protein